MARHGVPQVARRKLGQPHAELAGFQHIRNKVFVDGATVAGEVIAKGHRGNVRWRDFFGWVSRMSRGAVVVKLRRFAGINAGEHHLFRAFADVQRVAVTNFVALAIDGNGARPADVNHAQFTAFEEVAHAQLFAHFTAHGDGFRHRHNPAHNNAVNMAVDHGVLVGFEHLLN